MLWSEQSPRRGKTPEYHKYEAGERIKEEWVPLRKNMLYQRLNCVWNVMPHAQKPYFVFRRNGRVHLNRRGRQFSRLLAAEVRASAVVLQGTPCSEIVWRVLATHSIRQFPLHFPSRASPCAITFQMDSTIGLPSAKNGSFPWLNFVEILHISTN